MKFERLDGPFGKLVLDLDLATANEADLAMLLRELYASRFLVIRTNGISRSTYVTFARQLGEPIPLSRDSEYPEIALISNKNTDTQRSRRGAAHWHTDQSFRDTVSSITMLHSEVAPAKGGATQFCNMAAAYAALTPEQQLYIEDLKVIHQHGVSVSAPTEDHVPIPPPHWDSSTTALHPLVRQHPETQEKTLYAVTGTAQAICGMDHTEAVKLLRELTAHALQPGFVTSYKHQLHDIVLWDNPTVMHRATPISQAANAASTRLLWRISLKGSPTVTLNSA